MTDNKIGVKGAKSLSEMMRVNTTLTSLNLNSEKKKRERERTRKGKKNE